MSIEQQLILDASDAERTIAQIDQQLQQAAELFKVALADALAVLAQPIIAPIEADTSAAVSEVAALADGPAPIIPVNADTAEAEQLILALGDQPPVDIPVTAETSEAEQLILALGDQPPIDIPVAVDAEAARAEIAAFAGSAPPVDLLVEADTQGAQQSIEELGASASVSSEGVNTLEGSVTGLGAAAGIAEGSAKELIGAIGEMGGESGKAAAGGVAVLAAATAGFFQEGLNAVSAGQRFDMILGSLAEDARHIDINGLNTSISDLGIRFGSTGAEMENVNATLVQYAVNSGASKEEGIRFAQQIDTLGARAIALKPQLGTLADVTDALGSKIGRGGRFAAQYQIDLNGAEIATRALADTGKGAASDLTFVEKAMAGAELASAKYGATLAGTVAEGEKNAAVQAESLKASFKEAIEQIGVPLVAPVLDLIRQAEPDAVLIAQDLGTLAKDALPAVAAGLAAIDPPLRLISGILNAIPGPILAGAIAFWGFSAALNAVAGAALESEAALALASSAIPLIAAASAIAVGAMVLFGNSNADTQKHVAELTKELTDQDGVLRITTEDLTKYLEKSSDIGKDPSMVDALNKAGLSFADLAGFAEDGEAGLTTFIKKLEEAGVLDKVVSEVGSNARLASGQFVDLSRTVTVAGETFANTGGTGNQLVGTFRELQRTSQAAAQQQLATSVASKTLTDEQVKEAEARHVLDGGATDYIATLNELTPLISAASTETKTAGEEDRAAAQKKEELAAAMQDLATAAPGVVASMQAVGMAVGDQGSALEGLALSLNKANLSTAQMDLVAQQLGVSSQSLQGFIKDVTGELDNFVSTAVGKLPDVSSAIDNALDPASRKDKPIIIDPAKLEAELQHSIDAINNFNVNVQTLVGQGFNNLAQVAAERGPEFTQGIVNAIDKGGADMGATLDAKFGELNDLTAAEPDKLRTAGSGIIVATGDVADAASKNFGDKFQLGPPTQAQMDQAKLVAELANVPFAEALASVAGSGAVAYEQAIGAIPAATDTAMAATGDSIDAHGNIVKTAAGGVGSDASAAFQAGIGPIPANASTIIDQTAPAISKAAFVLRAVANTEGFFVGYNFTTGLATGIGDSGAIASVERAAASAVDQAVAEAKRHAGVQSPSKVTMEIGRQMGVGLALGISSTFDIVSRSGLDLASRAMPVAPDLFARWERVISERPLAAVPSSADAAPVAVAPPTPSSVVGWAGANGNGMLRDIGMFRDIVVNVDGAGVTDERAQRIGGIIGGAVVDRVSPVASRYLAVGVKVS